jgi:DNA-binding MarR family transcriptional regulator
LEASGHLAREANPEDRRSVRIQLTQTGREVAGIVAQAVLEANAAFLEPLTVSERRTLLRCITKLRLNKDV